MKKQSTCIEEEVLVLLNLKREGKGVSQFCNPKESDLSVSEKLHTLSMEELKTIKTQMISQLLTEYTDLKSYLSFMVRAFEADVKIGAIIPKDFIIKVRQVILDSGYLFSPPVLDFKTHSNQHLKINKKNKEIKK